MLSGVGSQLLTPRWLPPSPLRRTSPARVIMRKTANLQRAVNRRVNITRMQHRRLPNLHGGAVRCLRVTLLIICTIVLLAFQLTP